MCNFEQVSCERVKQALCTDTHTSEYARTSTHSMILAYSYVVCTHAHINLPMSLFPLCTSRFLAPVK